VLGVCLGHQGLGHLLNAAVTSAPLVMHGRLSRVRHDDGGLFEGIPQDFSVVRYHSLAVDRDLGGAGRVIAWTEEGVVMAIEHSSRPMWGVQFHPESIATEHGQKLIENFYALAHRRRRPRAQRLHTPLVAPRRCRRRSADPSTSLKARIVEGEAPSETLFERLFGGAEHAFWLDSADAPTALAQCSYLGTSAGSGRMVLEYDVQEGIVTTHSAGEVASERASIFDVLDRELQNRRVEPAVETARGLLGGFVGYLGYECKGDCGSPNAHRSDMSDAVLMFANRLVAVDHVHGRTHLLASVTAMRRKPSAGSTVPSWRRTKRWRVARRRGPSRRRG